MSIRQILAVLCVASVACGTFADEAKAKEAESEEDGLSFTPGEGLSFGDQQIVTAEFGLEFFALGSFSCSGGTEQYDHGFHKDG